MNRAIALVCLTLAFAAACTSTPGVAQPRRVPMRYTGPFTIYWTDSVVREEGDVLEKLEQVGKAQGWRIKGSRKLGSTQASTRAEVQALPTSHEIDLRGMTGDEAESALVLALDGAIAVDLPWLRIIHGKGTGALRARVAKVLKGDRRVEASKLAAPEQGGSGVTVAELNS